MNNHGKTERVKSYGAKVTPHQLIYRNNCQGSDNLRSGGFFFPEKVGKALDDE